MLDLTAFSTILFSPLVDRYHPGHNDLAATATAAAAGNNPVWTVPSAENPQRRRPERCTHRRRRRRWQQRPLLLTRQPFPHAADEGAAGARGQDLLLGGPPLAPPARPGHRLHALGRAEVSPAHASRGDHALFGEVGIYVPCIYTSTSHLLRSVIRSITSSITSKARTVCSRCRCAVESGSADGGESCCCQRGLPRPNGPTSSLSDGGAPPLRQTVTHDVASNSKLHRRKKGFKPSSPSRFCPPPHV